MQKRYKYDPEDIESLMLNKSFDELYPAEKEFVLRHLDSKEEYEDMRSALLNIKSHRIEETEVLTPPSSMKHELINEFDRLHSKPRINWLYSLNQLFAARPVYRNPVFQFSLAAMLIVSTVITIKIAHQPVDYKISQNTNDTIRQEQIAEVIQDEAVVKDQPTIESERNDQSNINIDVKKRQSFGETGVDRVESEEKSSVEEEKKEYKPARMLEKEILLDETFDKSEEISGKLETDIDDYIAPVYQHDKKNLIQEKKQNTKDAYRQTDLKAIDKMVVQKQPVKTMEEVTATKSKKIGYGKTTRKNKEKTSTHTRNLAQDTDLIELLYTAL